MVEPGIGLRQGKPVFCDFAENLRARASGAPGVRELVGQTPVQQIQSPLLFDVEFFSFAQSSPALEISSVRKKKCAAGTNDQPQRLLESRFRIPTSASVFRARIEI